MKKNCCFFEHSCIYEENSSYKNGKIRFLPKLTYGNRKGFLHKCLIFKKATVFSMFLSPIPYLESSDKPDYPIQNHFRKKSLIWGYLIQNHQCRRYGTEGSLANEIFIFAWKSQIPKMTPMKSCQNRSLLYSPMVLSFTQPG